MAATDVIAARHHFLCSHGGPGSRRGDAWMVEPTRAPPRTRSLPGLGIPAGYSKHLGNQLGLHHYADLRPAFQHRLDLPPHAPPPRKAAAMENRSKLESLWVAQERVRPETLPPAGVVKDRVRGKRLVAENTNTLSHVDTLIWAIDVDGSDGVLKQADSSIYKGAAGVNAKAERTPIYGDLPPTDLRTFGPSGTTTWDNPRGGFQRLDPRAAYVKA